MACRTLEPSFVTTIGIAGGISYPGAKIMEIEQMFSGPGSASTNMTTANTEASAADDTGGSPRVAIIVLNWNGLQDTRSCLESLFRLSFPHFCAVICDNDSTDGSVDAVAAWCERGGDHWTPPVPLGSAPGRLGEGIRVRVLEAEAARRGADAGDARVIIIKTGANRGFAGGNNMGLRWVQAHGGFAYAWLLNNDTVVHPGSLSALVGRMESDRALLQCGGRLMNFDPPGGVQLLGGGRINTWTGTSSHVVPDRGGRPGQNAPALHFISGACLLLRLPDRGRPPVLFDERLFLYFEEWDLTCRLGGPRRIGYADEALVWHREGASTGGDTRQPARRSLLSDYCGVRSRVLVTRWHRPWMLPTVMAGVAFAVVRRVLRRQPARGLILIRAAIFALAGVPDPWSPIPYPPCR